MKVALFASGRGSNVENIIQFFNGNKRINISLICSNNKSSGAVLHAKNHKIPYFFLTKYDLLDSKILIKEMSFIVKEGINFWSVFKNNFFEKASSNLCSWW